MRLLLSLSLVLFLAACSSTETFRNRGDGAETSVSLTFSEDGRLNEIEADAKGRSRLDSGERTGDLASALNSKTVAVTLLIAAAGGLYLYLRKKDEA